MEIARQRKSTIRMDMTPLIDCVFQLLIFFMLCSSYMTPKIALQLPKAGVRASPFQKDEVIITVDAQGSLYLNQTALSWDALAAGLRPLLAAAEKKSVTVRCDEMTPHRYFVRLLDVVQACGGSQVNVSHDVERK